MTSEPKKRMAILAVESMEVAEWRPPGPVDDAVNPPTEVHMIMRIHGLEEFFVMRFKSAKTIGTIIDLLIEYRDSVWPKPPAPPPNNGDF